METLSAGAPCTHSSLKRKHDAESLVVSDSAAASSSSIGPNTVLYLEVTGCRTDGTGTHGDGGRHSLVNLNIGEVVVFGQDPQLPPSLRAREKRSASGK